MTESGGLTALRGALGWPMARRSLIVALVVGTILNLINQGDAILLAGSVSWLKIALTYCVPFAVSTYGAYAAGRLLGGR
jgi:hypothetical protein